MHPFRLGTFGRQPCEEILFETVEECLMRNTLILGQHFRCPLMLFLLFSSGGDFVLWKGTVWTILVDGLTRNICMRIFFEKEPSVHEEVLFNDFSIVKRFFMLRIFFLFRALLAILFSRAGPFGQFWLGPNDNIWMKLF